MKFCVRALVGVIIKVILQNARCNNKDIYLHWLGVQFCNLSSNKTYILFFNKIKKKSKTLTKTLQSFEISGATGRTRQCHSSDDLHLHNVSTTKTNWSNYYKILIE